MSDIKAIIDVHNQKPETVESLRQQLAECQADNKRLRDALDKIGNDESIVEDSPNWHNWPHIVAREALALPSDSTALDTLKKQWQREALRKAGSWFVSMESPWAAENLFRMAKDLE